MSAAKRDEAIYRDPRTRFQHAAEPLPGIYPKIDLRIGQQLAQKPVPLAERIVCWLLRRA